MELWTKLVGRMYLPADYVVAPAASAVSQSAAEAALAVGRGGKRLREVFSLSPSMCVCVCERERAITELI